MARSQTALARLLQDRREAAGYSRSRLGELLGIPPGTIEGWEVGRVSKPPVHDVLRVAHVLGIATEEIERAVFADTSAPPNPEELGLQRERKKSGRRWRHGEVPVLEAAFRLLEWANEAEAADALGVSEEQVRAWRTGRRRMALPDYVTVASMVGLAAAAALREGDSDRSKVSAAAEILGLDRVS